MKRKILCLLMVLCIALLLVPAVSAEAKADGDSVAYYLAPYEMAKGDTVADVCTLLGIDFKQNEKLIRTVNHITNYTAIPTGSVIYLPVLAKPSSGAYYEIIKHTVGAGDTVYKLCKGYGVNYSSVTELLKVLNNITNLNRISKGQTFYIPVFHGTGSGTGGSGSGSGSGTGGSGGGSGSPMVLDGVAYYMIPHTLIKGETVNELCKINGVTLKPYENVIKAVNNITNLNRVNAGSTIYLPTLTAPTGGNYYTILFHIVSSGDTVYKLCKANGVDYSKNLALLKTLNNTTNLGRIVVGQPVYLPVFHTDGTGTGGSGSGGSGTGGSGGSADPADIRLKMTLPAAVKLADAKEVATKNGDVTIYYLSITNDGSYINLKEVASAPTGADYFMVVAHKVVSGDTVYKLCKAYGIDYARSLDLMRNINKQSNLNMIYKDDYIYLPVLISAK